MKARGTRLDVWRASIVSGIFSWERRILMKLPGPLNNIQRLPQFCPPLEACQHARLAGGDCRPSMGILEPSVCPSGKYCPPPGMQQFNCSSGHYCPRGSVKPLKCSIGAPCPEGTAQDQSFLPLGLLVILDLILVLWFMWAKLTMKRKPSHLQRRTRAGSGHFLKRAATTIVDKGERERQYHSLGDEEIHLESRITSVKRANTGFLAVIDNDYAFEDDRSDTSNPMEEKSNKDLNAFVSSLGRCVDTGTFGLSFEFENLAFVCLLRQSKIPTDSFSIPKIQSNLFCPKSLAQSK